MPKGKSDKPRRSTGHAPKDGRIIGSGPFQGVQWIVYDRGLKTDAHSRRWVNVKLIADREIPGKANYWLSYCLDEGDFRLTRDMRKLDVDRPELLTWVADKVAEQYAAEEESIEDLL